MAQRSQRPICARLCGCDARISAINSAASGLTLVELLAALLIASILLTVIVYTSNLVFQTWRTYTPAANLHSKVEFADEKLQDWFQNISTVDANQSTAQSLTCTDAQGHTVVIRLQSTSDHLPTLNGKPVIGFVEEVNSNPPQTNVVAIQDVSFDQSTFSIQSNGVQVNLVGTYLADRTFPTYALSGTFAVGGGY